MLRVPCSKDLKLIGIFCFSLVFGMTGARAQNNDLKPIESRPGLNETLTQLAQNTETLPNAKKRILTRVSEGQIDWQAAYKQMSTDVRQFRPTSQTMTVTSNEPGGFVVNDDVYRNVGAEAARVSRVLRTLDKPRLPILLPPDPPMLDFYKKMAPNMPNARAIEGKIAFFQGLDDHYAATYEMDGMDVMINGSRIVYESPKRKKRRYNSRIMSDGTRMKPIERDDVGVSISFNRFGAAYIIEISCQTPQTDTRCRDDAYINDVYEKLLLFGGRP
jgi:hypothetical protein